LTLGVFCFLWDDPLFNPDAEEFLELAKEDPNWAAEQRTKATLGLMNSNWKMIEEERAKFWWLLHRVKNFLPPNVKLQLLADISVNKMDSDFSYIRAVEQLEIEAGHKP
jgi:hypothetical protein